MTIFLSDLTEKHHENPILEETLAGGGCRRLVRRGAAGAATLSGFGFDWVQLLKEGTIDGVAVECVCLHCEKGPLDITAETKFV